MDPSLVGVPGEPIELSWSSDQARLYALGVGAGMADPTRELEFTTENSIGVRQRVLPTMAIAIAGSMLPELGEIDWTAVRIAGQQIRQHSELPVAGTVRAASRVAGVLDKGSAAMVRIETEARDANSGESLFDLITTWHVRGAGGRGSAGMVGSIDWTRPERPADAVVSCVTHAEQALLYRLVGHPNPIHSDPVFASRAGLPRPILQGPCLFGISGRVLLARLCGSDPGRFARMEARFTHVVYPGDTLAVHIWAHPGGALFQTCLSDGTVALDAGRFEARS